MQQTALQASAGAGLGLVARLKQTGEVCDTISIYQAVLAGWIPALRAASPGFQAGLLEQVLPAGDLLRLLCDHLNAPPLELCAFLNPYTPPPCVRTMNYAARSCVHIHPWVATTWLGLIPRAEIMKTCPFVTAVDTHGECGQ